MTGHSAGQAKIARAREVFLTEGRVATGVRPETVQSWRRSAQAGVSPAGHPKLKFVGPAGSDTALLRAAQPVAEGLLADIGNAEFTAVLTDSEACVVGRWVAGSRMRRLMDGVFAHPGYVFDEPTAGTNVLGTVIEDKRMTSVVGAEHFNESFASCAAIGAPIIHPATGQVEGVMSLGVPLGLPIGLLLPILTRAVKEVGTRLLSGYAGEDRALLDAFLRSDRRGPRRPRLAVNGRLLMANSLASDLIGSQGHAALWEQVNRAVADRRETVTFGAGTDHELTGVLKPLEISDGAVVQLSPPGSIERRRPRAGRAAGRQDIVAGLSRQVPGRSEAWTAVLNSSAKAIQAPAGTRLLITGPSGAGKRALADAILAAAGSPRIACFDARDARGGCRAWLSRVEDDWSSSAAVQLLRLDQLEPEDMEMTCRWLDNLVSAGRMLVGTFRADSAGGGPPAALVAQFEHHVAVPALDRRREDIPDIVSRQLSQGAGGGSVKIDAASVRQLMSRDWPGNVRQLCRVLMAARDSADGRTIFPEDLPEPYQARSGSRHRRLTYLQTAERDALSAALSAANGNRRSAAAALGISRSTLYRKLSALGLAE